MAPSTRDSDAVLNLTLSRRQLLQMAGVGALLPAGLLAGCGGGTAPSYEATIADARAAILLALADTQTPSASVALVDGERILWAEAFGKVDKAGTPPRIDTMFAIGSVSKVLAAIAAMILVDRQQVELDAPYARYVSDFRMAAPEYSQVTVRMLLSHSSGFPGSDYRNSFTFAPVPGYAAQVQQTLAPQRLKHLPGEMAVYCNDGFTLIELLVAALTGRPYTRFVEEEILAPLGMVHSRYATQPFAPGSYAPAFDGETPRPQEFVNVFASGGLCSTPSDMGRLAMMLINGGQLEGRRILSAAAVAEMGRDQTTTLRFNPVPTLHWGLGWDGVAQPGLAAAGIPAWHKNGGTAFYGSEFVVAPAARLAVMISGSTTTYGHGRLAERILLNALAESGRIAAVPSPLPPVAQPQQAPTDAELAAMVGIYANYNSVMRLQTQPDRTLTLSTLAAGLWSDTATGLRQRSDGSFSSDAKPLVSYRALNADGRRYLAMRMPSGYGHYLLEVPHGQKVDAAAPLSAAWQARAGKRWLLANEDPSSLALILAKPVFAVDAVADLPGYVLADGQIVDPAGSDTVARMFLKIPVNDGRDLDDLVVESRGGEEWLRFGSRLYRPQALVPEAPIGASTVTIDSQALAQWRKLPASGTLAVTGATAWRLYDAEFQLVSSGEGSGSTPLPGHGAAAWLVVYGAAQATIHLTVA